jgi:hypothetical protein
VVVEMAPVVDTPPVIVFEEAAPGDPVMPRCFTEVAHLLLRGAALHGFQARVDVDHGDRMHLCPAVAATVGTSPVLGCLRTACAGGPTAPSCVGFEPMLAFAAAERQLSPGIGVGRGSRWHLLPAQRDALVGYVEAFRATACEPASRACVELSNDVLWVGRCLGASAGRTPAR